MNARALSFALIFATIFGFGAANAQGPDKYALLVAVNDYDHPHFYDLAFPETDATAIGEVLKENGYTVDYLLGKAASQQAIQTALKKLRKQGGNGGVAFIGIFGHGVEFEKDNKSYFCPHDSLIRQSKDNDGNELFDKEEKPLLEPDPETLVAIDEYLAALRDSRAGNRILIADCCRDDPNRARGRSFGSAMQLNALPENTAVFFACSKNQRAYENPDWKHGAFTKCLLEELALDHSLMSSIAAKVAPAVHRLVEKVRDHGQPEQKPSFLQTGANVDLLFRKHNMPSNREMERQANGTRIAESIGLELIAIPDGPKVLGYEYSLGKFEVTQRQYTEVMGTNPSRNQESANLPVEKVSFLDAMEFCKKLTALESQAGRLPAGMVYRLPWKREWELAHGENVANLFPMQLQLLGWFGEDGKKERKKGEEGGKTRATRTVDGKWERGEEPDGSQNINALELHDLFGNVAELSLDQASDDLTKDPMYLAVGGSFSITPETFLKQLKDKNIPGEWLAPEAKRYDVGFRVVLGPADAPQPAK